jgi:hypothetical protein
MTEENQGNSFADMEKAKTEEANKGIVTETIEAPKQDASKQPVSEAGEMDIDQFSDVAVGDSIRYVRPDLDGQETVVAKLIVPKININEPATLARNGKTLLWPVKMQLVYESKNEDGLENREFISGANAFKQDDGSASPISFWYNGAGNQSAYLWELTAKHLGKEPKDISPREFVAFWNSKPKVKLVKKEYDNYKPDGNYGPGEPRKIYKNMPGEILP